MRRHEHTLLSEERKANLYGKPAIIKKSLDLPVHPSCKFFGNGKAKPGRTFASGLICFIKPFEHAVRIDISWSFRLVSKQADCFLAVPAKCNADLALPVIQPVFDNIADDPFKPLLISQHLHGCFLYLDIRLYASLFPFIETLYIQDGRFIRLALILFIERQVDK